MAFFLSGLGLIQSWRGKGRNGKGGTNEGDCIYICIFNSTKTLLEKFNSFCLRTGLMT